MDKAEVARRQLGTDGVFAFGSGDNRPQVMEDFIVKGYCDSDNKIDDFVLYQVV